VTIFNWQSNHGGRNVGSRLRGAGAIALGWLLFLGCAAELDRSQGYDWAFADGTPGQGGSGTAQGGMTGTSGGATGSGGGGTVTAPPDPACLKTMISSQSCTTCHGASAALIGGNLDLMQPNIGQRLLNKASSCKDNPPIIDGSNLNNSTFLKKVTNVPTGCNGTPMPPGTMGLTGESLQCVKDWIASFKP
jgi:hypothetical protein